MVVVAIAGGTGGLGRQIVEAIVGGHTHQAIILTRKAIPDSIARYGAPAMQVEYGNAEMLAKALEENNVHTVLSALNFLEGGSHQDNLIWAADRSRCTKRFVPSLWNTPITQEHIEAFPLFGAHAEGLKTIAKTSSLEHTVFYNGLFLDYYCTPGIKSYMNGIPLVIDAVHDCAALPGSSNVPVSFCHTRDIAKIVNLSLDLPKWENESWIMGEKVTWNEMLALVEAAKGTKFNVAYDSIDKLKQGKITEMPGQVLKYPETPKEMVQFAFAAHGLWFEDGTFDLKPTHTPLDQIFSDIKIPSIKETLEEAWQ